MGHRGATHAAAGYSGRGTLAALVLAVSVFWAGGVAAGTAARPPGELSPKGDIFRQWLPRALAGDATAAYKIGDAFSGSGARTEDFIEAARWYLKAARRGHVRAQNDLAMLFAKGQGVPQDYVRAYALFDLAAAGFEQGRRRDQAVELRDMMAAFMSPEQFGEAARLAAKWKAEAAR